MKQEPVVLRELKEKMISKGYAYKTQQFYLEIVREFILFHGNRNPRHMGMVEIELFMNYFTRKSALLFRAKQQAFQALMFFYTQVLRISLQKEYIDASRSSDTAVPVNRVGHKMVQSVMVF